MASDARDAAEFYATRLGRLTAGLLRQKLLELWPNCTGMSVLGLGYTGPFLQLWREQAARSISVSPQQQGVIPWPAGRPGLACSAEEDALPFPDLSFDRVLLVHGLEQAENARRTLREAWRVLKDDGRLIVVVPNRRGVWAYAESTPFGHGQPYSERQLARLLQALFFCVERREAALFAPPLDWRPLLRGFHVWERAGRALVPQLAGLAIAEASKDLHGVIPLKRRTVGRRVLVDALK
ncbi:MAG: methyltransferase type 11 [Acidocella sp. 20-61-6]|nr:MAG: methyltransferase type 11 [Acidocella sp. 20-61-6]